MFPDTLNNLQLPTAALTPTCSMSTPKPLSLDRRMLLSTPLCILLIHGVLGANSGTVNTVLTHLILHVQSTSLITTLGGASKRCPYSRSVVIPEVSLYVLQWAGTLLWAWKFCRYSRIVVISAVVISEVDCIYILLIHGVLGANSGTVNTVVTVPCATHLILHVYT